MGAAVGLQAKLYLSQFQNVFFSTQKVFCSPRRERWRSGSTVHHRCVLCIMHCSLCITVVICALCIVQCTMCTVQLSCDQRSQNSQTMTNLWRTHRRDTLWSSSTEFAGRGQNGKMAEEEYLQAQSFSTTTIH